MMASPVKMSLLSSRMSKKALSMDWKVVLPKRRGRVKRIESDPSLTIWLMYIVLSM